MKRFYFFALLIAFLAGCCTTNQSLLLKQETIAKETAREKFVNHLEDSTVVLLQKDIEDGTYAVLCAGVWISPNNFLSARHCAEKEITTALEEVLNIDVDLRKLPGVVMAFKTHDRTDEEIKIGQGDHPYFAVVSGYDTANDLVLFETISNVKHDFVSVRTESLFDGEDVLIVGHTIGMEYTVFPGTIAKYDRLIHFSADEMRRVIQISGPTWSGNSGGGAFDTDGNLIGIASFVSTRGPNIGFFVHRDLIIEFLQSQHVF